MNQSTKSRGVKNFLKHLAKGGVKSIPFVGGVVEEGIFGTLEANKAAEESDKLWAALDQIQSSLDQQTGTMSEVAQRLKQQQTLSAETRAMIGEMANELDDVDAAAISPEIEGAVEGFLARHGASVEEAATNIEEVGQRLEKAVDRLSVIRVDEKETLSRPQLIKRLSGLALPDMQQLLASIDGASSRVTHSVPVATQVFELVRWAESTTGPGLDSVIRTARELFANF